MPTIIVKNTRSKIIGLTSKQAAQLAGCLSVRVPNYYFAPSYKAGAWDGKEYFLTRPANTFPTGLCPKVVEFIQDAFELPVYIKDERVNPLTIPPIESFPTKVLRDYQIATINRVGSHTLSSKIDTPVSEDTFIATVKPSKPDKPELVRKAITVSDLGDIHTDSIDSNGFPVASPLVQMAMIAVDYPDEELGSINIGSESVTDNIGIPGLPDPPCPVLSLSNPTIQLEDYSISVTEDSEPETDTEPIPEGATLSVPFPCGVINIATNGGKTVIAEGIIHQLYSQLTGDRILLFLTHSKEIAVQARKSIMHDLSIPVGFIGNSKWDIEKVTVALIPTLYSRMKNQSIEWDNLRKNTVAFIADECHHSSSDSWYKILQSFRYAYVRLGLTGTIDKSNPLNEMKLYACTGDIISKISNNYLIKHGYSAKPICILIKVDEPELGELEYADAYQDGIVSNPYRNAIIRDICEKEAGNTTLILVQHLEHGEELMSELHSLGLRTYFTHGRKSLTERDELLEKLKHGGLDILISSNILDEGVDVSGINVLIYARGRKSMRQLLQGIGRGLRLKEDGSKLRFYDFVDNIHTILLEHSLERCRALTKEKFEVKMFELKNYLKLDVNTL